MGWLLKDLLREIHQREPLLQVSSAMAARLSSLTIDTDVQFVMTLTFAKLASRDLRLKKKLVRMMSGRTAVFT